MRHAINSQTRQEYFDLISRHLSLSLSRARLAFKNDSFLFESSLRVR